MIAKHILLLLSFLCWNVTLHAQNKDHVFGQVHDKNQKALSGITVSLGSAKLQTDKNGRFQFANIKSGNYPLHLSGIGYQHFQDTVVKIANEPLYLNITMSADDQEIATVEVVGQSETERAKRQAIRAVVVDTRAVAEQPVTLAELINRSSGVRIRQSGGLGNAVDVSLNGFQGRAVRYFKDGVPLNYLAGGYGIHNIPVNSLERVEVYKGVLPISLGADALGGAVNLITKNSPAGDQVDASYEIASFNTHRFSVNASTKRKSGLYTGLEAFYNYSDNNYNAFVMVPDPNTGNSSEQSVELFHNGYRGVYGEAFVGVQHKPWAKDLRFGLAYFNTERQQQHPILMSSPYGAALAKQSSVVPTLRYAGSFFDDRLTVEQFAVANTLQFNTVDTLQGRYDWFGNFTSTPGSIGESGRPSLSDIRIQQFTSRTTAAWRWNDKNTISANYTATASKRTGEDPFGPRFTDSNVDVLSARTRFNKQVLGLDWSGNVNDQWSYSLMGKWYNYHSQGTEAWASRPISENEEVQVSKSYFGAGGSLKYAWDGDRHVRFSTEYAYRIPEIDELFGDAVWTVPNFQLLPERSLNFNLGMRNRYRQLHFEVNTFYRRTRDLILLMSVLAPYAQYQNINNVEGYGVELDLSHPITSFLDARGNATWQSLRLFGFDLPSDQWRNGTRLQNTPYFFANLGLNAHFDRVGTPYNRLDVYMNYNFVREFYLETIPRQAEPGGFLGLSGSASVRSELVIPNQHLLSAGVSYRIAQDKYRISMEVKNMLDARLYDYFRVQRAGRSFHLKFTYQLFNAHEMSKIAK
ncbi:TonB-dependent receptor plug domain-containing protein [Sphingobacterium corticis]|uniref:TonB-dependent receptor plug domain-containing protein n=1 Tax=Sphingobacterium corticis TaxID=1812823 RepID=A0ABW5NNX3_9SPHI